ncbi:MAG: hypothetical protein E6H70_14860 [Betaproteobacteria bacterium]|nr:MAG: hypothetical protein E6H70_14860 [Betaproteobacteria bacterium]
MATIASLSFVILVDAAAPIKSIAELVAHLKAKPGASFYGATSNTGVIAAELFKTAAGVKATYVPYNAKRSAALPDVPTLAELGYGGTDVSPWWGVVVAAGTPKSIVDKLAGWFNQITAAGDTKQFLANAAFDPFPGTPEQMQSLLKSDAERWKRYVELAKIEPQ